MAKSRTAIDRRQFLQAGAMTTSLAFGCGARHQGDDEGGPSPSEMRYRPLGNTGLDVSEVAFGAHGVDNPPLMAAALDAGINTFCTSGRYQDGREEEALAEALASIQVPRDRVVILTGNPLRPGDTKQTILADFDASLGRLRTDYLDIYYNGMVSNPSDVHVDALFEAFEDARQAGKVRHLGVSGHSGGMQECLEAAIDVGWYEVLFTKYDFVSYPDQDEILQRASQRGIGTIVFKTNAGNRQREIEDLEAGGLSFQQATLRWALANADVASVAVTFTNFDQIRECTGAVGSVLTKSEVAMLHRYAGEMYDKYCRFCSTCEASCPHDVAIADVMRYAMYFQYYGREKESMRLYRAVPRRRSAAACDSCPGPCNGSCPFGRAVREGMLEAHRMLSFSVA
jgi:aryl-alcohol dehydrogenase-like predicted oxidoreductase